MNIRHYIALAVLTQTVGCASIVGGVNQSVSVQTRDAEGPVAGATCKLENKEGTWFVTTPGSATVHRAYGDLAVSCDKETYETGIAAAKSSTKALAAGNILFGGVIGAGVDAATGAAFDYPELITVVLSAAPAPIASPKADPSTSVVILPTSVAASAPPVAIDSMSAPTAK